MRQRITPTVIVGLWTLMVLVVGIIVSTPRKVGKLYPTFAQAGQQFQTGGTIYDVVPDHLDQFRYSPTVAMLLVPWSQLPVNLGGVLWRAVQAFLLLAAIRRASQTWWPTVTWPLLALGCLPLIAGNIFNGQLNPVVLSLMLYAGVWFTEEKWWWAAFAVAGATLIKIYPLAFGLLLVLVQIRRFLPRLLIALLVGIALPYLVQSADYVNTQYADWWVRLTTDDRTVLPISEGYYDFQKLLRRWGITVSLETYRLMETLAGLVFAGLVWSWRNRIARPELVARILLLALTWCCLFGPSSESATYMLLAPVAVWGMMTCSSWIRAIPYGLLIGVTVSMWFPKDLRAPYTEIIPQAHAAMLLLIQMHFTWRRHSREMLSDSPLLPLIESP